MNDSSSNPDPLDALFARARAERPDTSRAEYAFETRLLARLRQKSEPARGGIGLLAWRMLPFFAVVVLALGILQHESGSASQEAEQAASLQNPETVDLFSSLE
jgi:hypothetical protein